MKKVRTIATKQGRNISGQRLTIGLDLGDRNSWQCLLEEAGRYGCTPSRIQNPTLVSQERLRGGWGNCLESVEFY